MVLWFSLAYSSDEVTVLLRKGVSFLLLLWSIKHIYGFKYLQKKLKKRKDKKKNWKQKQEHNTEMLPYAHLSP